MRKAAVPAALCCLVLFLFTLTGCKSENTPPSGSGVGESDNSSENAPEPSAGDYFPITENTRYAYLGEGNEYASYTVYNDYTSKSQVQQRVDNGGTVTVNVISILNGQLVQTFSSGETYYRENLISKTGKEDVLLEEPIAKGTTWKLEDGRTRTITDTSAKITTPSGSYDAIEVTTEGSDNKSVQYYAKDVGLIKTVYSSGDYEVTSMLSSIEKDVPFKQSIRFFYPNADEGIIYFVDREIEFHTNDVTAEILAKAYKEAPNGVNKVFSENTAIKALALGDNSAVYVDLNQAFLSEMNAGSGYEGMILNCIADTFGNYYNIDRVVLTIEGEPYSSGHFAYKEGEYLQVDLTKAVQLQK